MTMQRMKKEARRRMAVATKWHACVTRGRSIDASIIFNSETDDLITLTIF
jgi:hypothetical protein